MSKSSYRSRVSEGGDRDRKAHVRHAEQDYETDLSPSTSVQARSSVDTYASSVNSEDDVPLEREGEDRDYIPPLPSYHHEITEPHLRPSNPKDFARLFPSLNRFSIRHDDFTDDGNMNLRVDTIVPGRRRTAVQLFHLRMYDLAKREFSLRRYCRDSGREVCNSKRTYITPPASRSRPTLQRSMSSAMKTLAKPQFRRQNSSSSVASNRPDKQRPATSYSSDTTTDASSLSASLSSHGSSGEARRPMSPPQPTNAIRLEFSNYARVDVERKGSKSSKRYEFKWWGHRYMWKRVAEQHLEGVVSFHLMRDGEATPIAHIVPETRSPVQVEADERAGGWIPPCYMWINDKSILEAVTDVADVIIATGLMALVDDCIKERWQTKKIHHLPVFGNVEYVGPRAFIQRVFSQRRVSSDAADGKSHFKEHEIRHTNPIPAF